MEGLTKKQIDEAESRDFAKVPGRSLRPRDAATLILIDRDGREPRVLMGRRSLRHAFMPGRYVFPGGRTDPTDSRIPVAAGLPPEEEQRLPGTGARASAARARAIALSAVRETYEEAGLLIGRPGPFATNKEHWQGFVEHGVQPALDGLRFVARAITPPGRVRRFDTRFLAAWRDEVAVALPQGGPTNELEELVWLSISEAMEIDIPLITRSVLRDLQQRLADDPDLRPGGPVPFYRTHGNKFLRDLV